ncbi:hypothetical protein [Kitasatospora sp. NPDC002965]|uniref:hypothetical protein n=1 Tax=Kitasatospora sp. NPDC002965 TaxID=3154775 RepID=UPI0033A817C7
MSEAVTNHEDARNVRNVPDATDATDSGVCALAPGGAEAALVHDPELTGPRADCVLCGDPTELPADHPGSTLCPVCAWQQAQRIACSG